MRSKASSTRRKGLSPAAANLKQLRDLTINQKRKFIRRLLSRGDTERLQKVSAVSQDIRTLAHEIPFTHIHLIRAIRLGNTDARRYTTYPVKYIRDFAQYFLHQFDSFSAENRSLDELVEIAKVYDHPQRVFAEQQLAHIALHESNEESRANAMDRLAKLSMKSEVIVDALIAGSNDPDSLVKWIATSGLKNILHKDRTVVQAHIRLLGDQQPEIRETALKGLATIETLEPEVVDVLRYVAHTDQATRLRKYAQTIIEEHTHRQTNDIVKQMHAQLKVAVQSPLDTLQDRF